MTNEQKKIVTIVLNEVSKYLGTTVVDLKNKRRGDGVLIRSMCFFLIREFTGLYLADLAVTMGKKHAASYMFYYLKSVKDSFLCKTPVIELKEIISNKLK